MAGSNTTIKDLADEARIEAITELGEAAFAKACMQFEHKIVPDDGPVEGRELWYQANGLMKMLAHDDQDAKFWQFAMIWLDGHGYGDWSVIQVHERLQKLKTEIQD